MNEDVQYVYRSIHCIYIWSTVSFLLSVVILSIYPLSLKGTIIVDSSNLAQYFSNITAVLYLFSVS